MRARSYREDSRRFVLLNLSPDAHDDVLVLRRSQRCGCRCRLARAILGLSVHHGDCLAHLVLGHPLPEARVHQVRLLRLIRLLRVLMLLPLAKSRSGCRHWAGRSVRGRVKELYINFLQLVADHGPPFLLRCCVGRGFASGGTGPNGSWHVLPGDNHRVVGGLVLVSRLLMNVLLGAAVGELFGRELVD